MTKKQQLRSWRAANPIHAAYLNLKNNAKRRGKKFTLTLVQFEKFCVKTDYMQGKGKHATSYHIDRIDETKGYTIRNIQVLKNATNLRKYCIWKGIGEFTTVTDKPAPTDPNCPF
jgi:hypothetical protein